MTVPCTKTACVFVIVLLTFVSASFCQTEQPAGSAASPIKIGYLMDSLKIERWQTDLDEFQNRARALGAEVLAETADGDEELQFQQAQNLVNSGIQVLVLVPCNTETADRIVKVAKSKHVPVLDYDRLVRKSDIDLFVSFDDYGAGMQQAYMLSHFAPKGNYVLIGGPQHDINAQMNRSGQMFILKPLIDRGDIKIVSDAWTEGWDPAKAYMSMAKAIGSTKGKIAAVVASDDGTAGGAIQALAEHDLAGKVPVSGQDAELSAIIRVIEGTQTMTVYKPVPLLAQEAADAAVLMAKGMPVETSKMVDNGLKNVAAILLDPITVTKDNFKEIVVKSGFQKMEMIKQGLSLEKQAQLQ